MAPRDQAGGQEGERGPDMIITHQRQDQATQSQHRTRSRRGGLATVLAIVLALFATSAPMARSEATAGGAAEFPPFPGGPSDPAEVESFLDGLITPQLEKHHIPGAVVVVVKDGKILYAGGYGFADVERQLPFVPDQTLFRIGSTSKLFTWTAVMQLAEQGRIDLDADVNSYLTDFQIPATFPQAITMRHLMSHSAGFEDGMVGAVAAAPEEMAPLSEYVMKNVQARVRPPGALTAYSNYGATLAGYIVEAVSGAPFESYIEKHIFVPLGMESSTFRQPLPEAMAEHLAVSYDFKEVFRPQPMLYINQAPAGSMSATATDLARFMIAHLQDGRYGDARILEESTARQMHTRLFSNDPRLSGMAYGFFDQEINGQRVLHHGGGLPAYMGMLGLVPEDQSGFYVGYNGLSGNAAVADFMAAYFDHYYPSSPANAPLEVTDRPSPAGTFAGLYRSTRVPQTTLESLANLTELGYVRVIEEADGAVTLRAVTSAGEASIQGREAAAQLFVSSDGRKRFAFGGMQAGIATLLVMDDSPHVAFERIAWYDAPTVRLRILAISLVIILSFPMLAGLRRILARRKTIVREPSSRLQLGAAAALAGTAVLVIAGMVGFIWISAMGYWLALYTTLLSILSWLCVLLSLLVTFCAVHVWIRSTWSPLRRVHYSVFALAGLGFVWCLDFWNVIDLAM